MPATTWSQPNRECVGVAPMRSRDNIPDPDPTITSLNPSTAVAGSGTTQVTVTGTQFRADSKVEANQAAIPTTFVSATSLTAQFPVPATAGPVTFTVRTDTEESNPSTFTVTASE